MLGIRVPSLDMSEQHMFRWAETHCEADDALG